MGTNKEKSYPLRLPEDLKRFANEKAKETHRTLRQYIIDLIMKDKEISK